MTFWTPVLVALAYLPDIIAQLFLVVGLTAWSLTCHSLILAAPASLLVAVLLCRLFRLRWRLGLLVAVVSIFLHDLLDVLAGGHCLLLWWPISDRQVRFASRDATVSMTREVLIYGGAFLVVLAIRWAWRRWRGRPDPRAEWGAHPLESPSRGIWLSGAFTFLILLSAAATHRVRDLRERQLHDAWSMINRKQCASAFGLLDQAERWPSTAEPGRIDYARAEAYTNMGQRAEAEEYYLRAYRADPSYFWTVADLAVFYASSDEPLDVRRRRVAPYMSRLTGDFAKEQDLPRILAKLERKMAGPSSRDEVLSGMR